MFTQLYSNGIKNSASKYHRDTSRDRRLDSRPVSLVSDADRALPGRNGSRSKHFNNYSISTHQSDRHMEKARRKSFKKNKGRAHWLDQFVSDRELGGYGPRQDFVGTSRKTVGLIQSRSDSVNNRIISSEQRKQKAPVLPLTPKASSGFENPFKSAEKKAKQRKSSTKADAYDLLTKHLISPRGSHRQPSFSQRNTVQFMRPRSKSPIMGVLRLSLRNSVRENETVSMRGSFIESITAKDGLTKSLISPVNDIPPKPFVLKSILKKGHSKRRHKGRRVQLVESRNEVFLVSKWIRQHWASPCDSEMIQVPVTIIGEPKRTTRNLSNSNVKYNTELSFGFEKNFRKGETRVRAPTPYRRSVTPSFHHIHFN